MLNPQSGKPIYRQLIDQIRRMIASGDLRPGEVLPSVRSLALDHAVNPMTISKAFVQLEAEGLLERNPGKPMSVANPANTGPAQLVTPTLPNRARELVRAARAEGFDQQETLTLLKKLWEED